MNCGERKEVKFYTCKADKRLMSNNEVWVLFHRHLLQVIIFSLIHLASRTPGSLFSSNLTSGSFLVSFGGSFSLPSLSVGGS